jgi:segregation and condensation protein A
MIETEAQAEMAAPDWNAPGFEDMPAPGQAFVVDIDGFEGPLDLLLALARTQKVDLSRISILALVEQYLAFIADAQHLRLEIAADYLVMAAWLAYLKSRLLLPKSKDAGDTVTAEELAQRLAFRLMRLEAMRDSAATLMTRRRLDRDVFARGLPEPIKISRDTTYTAMVYDLLKAYAEQRRRTVQVVHVVKARRVWSIKEARRRLEKLVGATEGDWAQLDLFLEQYMPKGEEERTVLASSFGATLEMAREGLIELRQDEPFAPIYMRKREAGAQWEKIG